MISVPSSKVTKKLALQFILENIDFRKRSSYLQEIIAMGRTNEFWLRALASFFDEPMNHPSLRSFSKN